MRLNSKELSKAVRYALYAGAATAVGLTAAPVFAQSDEAGSEKLETIVVTGSRIRRADIETAQPVFVIDRKTIENQGFTSVADILQNLTSSGSPAISRSQVLSSGENVGGYYVDLRNLGANRTLILIDGKRLGATSGGYQDLGQIPTSAIERIEVLKDGASSIYGSDAIAGVVNVITRSRFNGAEGSAYVGQFDQDDGTRTVYDFTLGSTSDRSSVTMSMQYAKEDPVWARDRWFSANGAPSPVSQNGSFCEPCSPATAAVWYTLIPGADPTLRASYRVHGAGDNANSNQSMMVQTGIERRSLFVTGTYDITDNIKFRADGLYNSRITEQEVAGYPFQTAAFGIPLSADSAFNWTGNDVNGVPARDLNIRRRLWEMPRNTQSKTDTYRVTGGLEGYFDIGDHSWNWDVGASLNRNNANKRGRGDMSLVAAELAMGPSFINANGIAQCGTPDNPLVLGTNYAAGECMPWNPLLPFGVAGQGSLSDPTLQNFLFPIFTDTGLTRSTSYTANIGGTLFALPAGDLGIAAGYEHRIESGVFTPDAFAQTGLYTGLAASTTNGKYALDEFYVEFDIPLLKDLPFAKQLSINVASRYSDYDTFGDTTNNKFGLQWRPIDDLLVRGTYADGFRAPSIDNMFGGTGSSFEYYTDPCSVGVPGSVAGSAGCLASGAPANYVQLGQGLIPCTRWPCQSDGPFITGSNPNLTPENSNSKTLGLVYSPSYIEGLDINLDWWKIRIENVISGDEVDDILKDCFVYGVTSRCTGAGLVRAADGHITAMNYGLANKGFIETEGYDLSVGYRLPEFSFGRFALKWDTTYTSVYDTKADSAPTTAVLGNVGYATTPRIRSNLSLDWDLGSFGATWTTRYYSAAKESCVGSNPCSRPDHIDSEGNSDPLRDTGSNAFHDVQLRWTAPWDGTFAVGANNVGEHYGPTMYTSPVSQYQYYGGFDIGRFYYAKYTQRF